MSISACESRGLLRDMRRERGRSSAERHFGLLVSGWTCSSNTPRDLPRLLQLHSHRRHVDQVDRSSATNRGRRPCLHRQLALPHALHQAVRDPISHREADRRLTSPYRSSGEFKSAIVSTADTVTDAILESVGDCAQSKYFIVRQPGLALADLQNDASSSISARADSVQYEQRVEIPSVMRTVDADSLVETIASRCGTTRDESRSLEQLYTSEEKEVTLMTLPSLEAHKRKEGLEALCKSSPDDAHGIDRGLTAYRRQHP